MELVLLLTAYPAYLVARFFIRNDPAEQEPKHAIHSAFWFGVLSIVFALVLSIAFDFALTGELFSSFSGDLGDAALPLALNVLIFASIEEIVKFVPISIYLLKKDYFNEVSDGIIYFSIVGLTFGAIESFLYAAFAGDLGFAIALVRLGLGLFFHGALTSIVGYHFAKAKVFNRSPIVALFMLVAVSIAHAGYNYFIFTANDQALHIFGAALIATTANAIMFWLFFEAAKHDVQLQKTVLATTPPPTQQAIPPMQQDVSLGQPQPVYPNQPTVQPVQPPVQPTQPQPAQQIQPTYTPQTAANPPAQEPAASEPQPPIYPDQPPGTV